MDPLSVAASSFAVVGVADVVLRTCLKCQKFLSDIEDAPVSIENLRTCLRNNTSLVQTLKKHMQDIDSTASPEDRAELGPAIEQFNIAIRSLRRETDMLLVRCLKYSKMMKTWANVRHVLAEKDIRKTTERMEQAKSTLSIVLSLVEGKRSAIGHKKIEMALLQTSNQVITALEPLRKEQTTVVSQNNTIISHTIQQKQATSETRREIRRFRHVSQEQHDILRRQIGRDTNMIVRKLEDIHVSSSYRVTKGRSNRRIFLRGADREAALVTLLLMKQHVRQAVVKNIDLSGRGISQQEMNLVVSEFDRLVCSALHETAAQHPDSTATPLDSWYYSGALGEGPLANVPAHGIYPNSNQCNNPTLTPSGQPDRKSNFRSRIRRWTHETDAGQVLFSIAETPNGSNQEHNIESQITFVSNAEKQPLAASVRFTQERNTALELPLHVQLNIFRVVENWTFHEYLYCNGSVVEIDAAFREGRITPYDVFEGGIIISFVLAGLGLQAEILRYLDSQGVGPVALSGYGDVIHGLWRHIVIPPSSNIPKSSDGSDMQLYLDGHITSFTTTTGLHSFLVDGHIQTHLESDHKRLIPWRNFYLRNGVEDEFQEAGLIHAFRYHCMSLTYASMVAIKMLLELGMDPTPAGPVHAAGMNALHLALSIRPGDLPLMVDKKAPRDPVSESMILEHKLVRLIEAGADINHRESNRLTPSWFARLFNRWDVWCQALRRAGFTIEDVLQEEGNGFLQEAGWEIRFLNAGFSREMLGLESDEESGNGTDQSSDESWDEDAHEPSDKDKVEEIEDAHDETHKDTC